MCKRFELYTQNPKPRLIGFGVLSIGRGGDAYFFSGLGEKNAEILADMVRVKIEWAGADAITLSGFEPIGYEKSGRPKYRYQEWLLRYINEGKERPR